MEIALRAPDRFRLATVAGLTGLAVLAALAPAHADPVVDVAYTTASANVAVSSQAEDTGDWILVAYDGDADMGVAAAGTYPTGGGVELTCGEDGDWLTTTNGATFKVTRFTLLNTDYDVVEVALDASLCVASPEPTTPEPTSPEPTDPEPTSPEPTDPEPTSPEPTTSAPTSSTASAVVRSATSNPAAGQASLAETGTSTGLLAVAGAAVGLGSLLVWRRRRELIQGR